MAVTPDKYELPMAVEESVVELANRLGIEPTTVYLSLRDKYSGKNAGRRIVKVRSL